MEEPGSFIVSLVICAARALTSPGLTHGTGAEVRHRLAVILGLAVCAVLAGARSFTAIAEWAVDADGKPWPGWARRGRCRRNRPSAGPCNGSTLTPSMTWPAGGPSGAPRPGQGPGG